jgi:hypothetical protein
MLRKTTPTKTKYKDLFPSRGRGSSSNGSRWTAPARHPHSGFISTIPAGATPYPHRSGVLYSIQYIAFWRSGNDDDGSPGRNWISDFMGQYVTKNPREAYVSYRDLEIGQNTLVDDVSTLDSGKVCGEKYFGGNFQRLATVKGRVDPTYYFRNEQSIPPLLQGN